MNARKLRKSLLATATVLALGITAPSANAVGIEDAWNLNLSLINGLNPHGWVGLTDLALNDHLVLDGETIVDQDVVSGNPLGQSFTDRGFLSVIGRNPEGGGGFDPTLVHLNPVSNGFGMNLFFEFTGLTGTLNLDATISFDPNVGTIKLWLEDDADGDSATGAVLELAEFTIIAPSGGSDLNFFGGGGANATIDITLEQLSGIDPNLYTDSANNPLGPSPFNLHLGNLDSFIDPNFLPGGTPGGGNPNNDACIPDNPLPAPPAVCTGVSVVHLQNTGQYNIETLSQDVPEPGSLAALGFGLLAFGGMVARRRKTAA